MANRSTNLDAWKPEQIKRMIAGGNHRARTFFRQKGMSDLSNVDAKSKYSSRVAKLYKAKLDKDAK